MVVVNPLRKECQTSVYCQEYQEEPATGELTNEQKPKKIMKLLLFLGLSSMLLSGPTEAASRHRRQQPANVSSPDWTETIPTENTGHTMNMLDLDDHAEFSNNDSVPLMPLGIKPPAIDSLDENNEEHTDSNKDSLPNIPLGIKPPSMNSIDTNTTSGTCDLDFCQLLEPCDSNSTCITSPFPECTSSCLPHGSNVILPAIENTGHTMNMLDLDDHAEFSNNDSVPLIPLGIKPPAIDSLDEKNEEHTDLNKDSLPNIPLGIKPPSMNSIDTNTTSGTCDLDFCQFLGGLCDSNSTCITSPFPECISRCLPHGSNVPLPAKEGVSSEHAKTVSPPRKCPGGFICVHGFPSDCNASSTEGVTCMCDEGWTGPVCNQPCTLSCVHGVCGVLGSGQMFCNCEVEYIGKACDELLPDPEEKARILAAILTSALVVALMLIIAIPIIMWRLRVILILKLVYIFKEYEDEDGKEIDAYVSMTSSANTESFVYGSLQPILEKHNFKLFLQARDAPAGEVMSETILAALEKSRRTIMIITPDYITNEWSRFEYLIAQHEALKLHQRIIPIILEDVEKESVNMDKSLKHILDSIKCLKYPKAKPKSISSSPEEMSENIQSPDSNISVNSTTHFYIDGRSNSTVSLPEEDNQFERKAAKFWKRLVLTMPKKKSQKNAPFSFLPILGKQFKYDINKIDCKGNFKSMDSGKETILECNSKISFFNDINHHAFCKHSANP